MRQYLKLVASVAVIKECIMSEKICEIEKCEYGIVMHFVGCYTCYGLCPKMPCCSLQIVLLVCADVFLKESPIFY